MSYGNIAKINIILFILYAITIYPQINLPFLDVSKIFLGIAIIFISGINITVLIQIFGKRNFNLVKILSLTFIGAIVFLPLVLLAENQFLTKTHTNQPIITATLISLLTIATIIFSKKIKGIAFELPKFKIKTILLSPLTWTIFLGLILFFFLTLSYNFLPDKDPFTWYQRLTQHLENNTPPKISYRPLFYSTSFLFNSLTDINIFSYLKYIVPLMFLAVFPPIWMVAKKNTSKKRQLMILLIPFLAPNTLIYFMMGIPQTFFLILFIYFIFFLIYSYLTSNKFYYYFSGIIALGSTFYHEIGTIIFAFWVITTLIYERKKIISNKKELVLVALIFLSNFSFLQGYFNFFKNWVQKAADFLSYPHFNWMFPLKYKGFDGTEEGSQTLVNVAKTYLGYAGPIIILSFLLFVYLFLRRKINFKKYWSIIVRNCEIQILLGLFIFFFIITEILPRFPGIVLFPDRIWVFTTICFSLFIVGFVFLKKNIRFFNRIFAIYLFCILLSIGGALYVNYYKKYQITENQFHSAEWIKNNLPEDRIILTASQPQLIGKYSQSAQVGINENTLYDCNKLNTLLNSLQEEIYSITEDEKVIEYSQVIIKSTEKQIHKYLNSKNIKEKNNIIENLALKNIELSENLFKKQTNQDKTKKQLYIYYTEMSRNNLSFNRPNNISYWGTHPKKRSLIILDHYPDKFKKIYENNDGNKVIIWKIL